MTSKSWQRFSAAITELPAQDEVQRSNAIKLFKELRGRSFLQFWDYFTPYKRSFDGKDLQLWSRKYGLNIQPFIAFLAVNLLT